MMTENKTLEEALMCQTLGTLVGGGVPILESINLTAEAHPTFRNGLKVVHDSVREGGTFADPMKGQGDLFTPLTYQLAFIGEETGDLDKMLNVAGDLLIKKYESMYSDDELREITFYRAFGSLIGAGLPMLRSIRILEQSTDYLPSEVLRTLGDNIDEGYTLSEAMNKQPDRFNSVIRGLITAGESGGVLDKIVVQIANYLEKRYEATKTEERLKGSD